jgi:hypothetical protein
VIPESAVEAAGRALAQPAPYSFDSYPQYWMERARAALEAAAPHLMAAAFEQGQKSGMRHRARILAAEEIGRPDLPGPLSPNPYRKPTDARG